MKVKLPGGGWRIVPPLEQDVLERFQRDDGTYGDVERAISTTGKSPYADAPSHRGSAARGGRHPKRKAAPA
jgi:hypothetical protein